MEKQYSYGAIVVRQEKGNLIYLLVKNFRGEWGFPKGHKEKNEKPLDTAMREIWEETSIKDLKFAPGFKEELVYRYEGEIKTIEKHAIYFIAVTTQSELKCLDAEHTELRWGSYEEAMKLLTFENTKELLKKARSA